MIYIHNYIVYIYTTWICKFPDIFGTCVLSPVLREVFSRNCSCFGRKWRSSEATENCGLRSSLVFFYMQWWWSHFWAPVYYSLWYANNYIYIGFFEFIRFYKPTNFTGKPCHCSYVTWRAPLRPRAQHRMGVSMALFYSSAFWGHQNRRGRIWMEYWRFMV